MHFEVHLVDYLKIFRARPSVGIASSLLIFVLNLPTKSLDGTFHFSGRFDVTHVHTSLQT